MKGFLPRQPIEEEFLFSQAYAIIAFRTWRKSSNIVGKIENELDLAGWPPGFRARVGCIFSVSA